MKPKVVYELVGFDRNTERMAERHSVPPSLVRAVKEIAGIADKSDDELGDQELTDGQVKEIARLIEVTPDLQRCDFFLAPSAADQARGQAKGRKTTMAT